MRSIQDDAILLKIQKYRESDYILSLFMKDHGKRTAIARSAAKSRRRFGGALESGALLKVFCTEQIQKEWLIMNEVARVDHTSPWRSSFDSICTVSFVLEMVFQSLPPHQEATEKFLLLENFLTHMEGKNVCAELLVFQFHWFRLLGWGLAVAACAQCGRPWNEGETWQVKWQEGGIFCSHCRRENHSTISKNILWLFQDGTSDVIPAQAGIQDFIACQKIFDLYWQQIFQTPLKSRKSLAFIFRNA